MGILGTDYSGQRFGNLTAIRKGIKHSSNWLFKCDCGAVGEHNIYSVLSKRISLTCTHLISLRKQFKKSYDSWKGMIDRCTKSNNAAYKSYGARGITVHASWLGYPKGFEQFLQDMGGKPESMTLERIDVNKGYSPSNCTWASLADQNRNKQYHRLVEYGGVTKPLFKWVTELELNYYTTHSRLHKGQSAEEALFGTKPRATKCNLRHSRHIAEILKVMDYGVLYTRKELIALTGKDRETMRETMILMEKESLVLVSTIKREKIYSRK